MSNIIILGTNQGIGCYLAKRPTKIVLPYMRAPNYAFRRYRHDKKL